MNPQADNSRYCVSWYDPANRIIKIHKLGRKKIHDWCPVNGRRAGDKKKKVCHHGWWDRQRRRQGDQSPGSESLTVGPAEINEVWGLSRAGSPEETMHHTLKASCSLETARWGCGSETEIEQGQQNWEQQGSASRSSAAFNASLYLAITAVRAPPDEKTLGRRKKKEKEKERRILESWHLLPKGKWKPELNGTPATLQTWHSRWLRLTQNTDESRKRWRKWKWTCSALFSGPQISSAWEFENLVSNAVSWIHPSLQPSIRGAKAYLSLIKQMPELRRKNSQKTPSGGGVRCVSNPRLVYYC